MVLILYCFKEETAYEMRISDWSSDVCASDLIVHVINFTLEIAKRNITERTIRRAHGKELCCNLDCSHNRNTFIAGNLTGAFYTKHALIDMTRSEDRRVGKT